MSIDVQTAPNNMSLLRTELGLSLRIGLKHFELDYLQGKNAITHTATGRGTVYFFKHDDTELVLRHYHRGGMTARFNKERFLYVGLARTRGFKELAVLDYLHEKGLSVPRPVAARVQRKGQFYTCDIITEALSGAQELHEMLKLHEVSDELWENIGKTLAQLHNLGVRHDDINVKNVLIQDNKQVALIDFDKCRQQALGNWQSANLARFYRSLIKQHKRHPQYHFKQSNWETLQAAYADHLKHE